MPEIAHNGTVRPTWTAGPPSTLCQRAQKSPTKAHSSPFSPPTTYPRNTHNGTFVPVSAAHEVPKNRTRPYPADRHPDGILRPAGPSHFCLIEPKLTPGADGGPCTPQPSAGPRGPAPQARPGPSGPDPARVAKAGRAYPDTVRRSANRTRGLYGPAGSRRQSRRPVGQIDPASLSRAGRPIRVSAGSNAARKSAMGLYGPRIFPAPPGRPCRRTDAPAGRARHGSSYNACSGTGPRSPPDCIRGHHGTTARHDGGKSKVRGTRLVCRPVPVPVPDSRTPWLHGPWLHGTNESDLGSRLTLDRGILDLSEFGRARHVRPVWATSGSCPRPSTIPIESGKAPTGAFLLCLQAPLIRPAVPPGAFLLCFEAPFRIPAVPPGAFLLCLYAPFCCTSRRFCTRPRRPRIYTQNERTDTGRARLPRILPTLAGRPPAAHVPARLGRPNPEIAVMAVHTGRSGTSRASKPAPADLR